jgi:hypothetical protein
MPFHHLEMRVYALLIKVLWGLLRPHFRFLDNIITIPKLCPQMTFLVGPSGWKSREAKSRLCGGWDSTAQSSLRMAFLVWRLVKCHFTCPCSKCLVVYSIQHFFLWNS